MVTGGHSEGLIISANKVTFLFNLLFRHFPIFPSTMTVVMKALILNLI